MFIKKCWCGCLRFQLTCTFAIFPALMRRYLSDYDYSFADVKAGRPPPKQPGGTGGAAKSAATSDGAGLAAASAVWGVAVAGRTAIAATSAASEGALSLKELALERRARSPPPPARRGASPPPPARQVGVHGVGSAKSPTKWAMWKKAGAGKRLGGAEDEATEFWQVFVKTCSTIAHIRSFFFNY